MNTSYAEILNVFEQVQSNTLLWSTYIIFEGYVHNKETSQWSKEGLSYKIGKCIVPLGEATQIQLGCTAILHGWPV